MRLCNSAPASQFIPLSQPCHVRRRSHWLISVVGDVSELLVGDCKTELSRIKSKYLPLLRYFSQCHCATLLGRTTSRVDSKAVESDSMA